VRERAPEHGLVAEYATEDSLVLAIERARALGYRELDVLMPYASDRVATVLVLRPSPLPRLALAGALLGGTFAYAGQYWTRAIDYPLNAGGKPLHAWPAFVPITFELTVLSAALAIFVGLFWLCRLPRLSHAIFAARGIERASDDRFFLIIGGEDPRFDRAATEAHLRETAPITVQAWGEPALVGSERA
jgi:hypothetical protein